MEYAQLNEALTEATQITSYGDIEWDSRNLCSARALTRDGKAALFRVVPLTVTQPPTIDPMTQSVQRDGCEKAGDEWRYKWRVTDLTSEEIAAKEAAVAAAQAEAAAQAKTTADAIAAKADAKLSALGNLSPTQVRNWVGANVSSLADAKDVLSTLAVAVSILSRRL